MQQIRSARRGLLLTLALLSACAAADPSPNRVPTRVSRDAPSGVFGGYLSGRFAMSEADSQMAATQFLRALASRPDDAELQQQAFIASYDKLLNRLEPDESVVFVDAVHPTHQARPAGCWAPKDVTIGIEQTTGRQRLNIHGAINLETGQTQMLEVPKVDAMSVIMLLVAIEAAYSGKKWIHVFLDNASYHHAILVREWLKLPGRRIKLYFTPSYCPHLAPIERCWGVMHEQVTHNQTYETLAEFRLAIMTFLRRTIPKNWDRFRDRITDNFRVISPNDFRVIA